MVIGSSANRKMKLAKGPGHALAIKWHADPKDQVIEKRSKALA